MSRPNKCARWKTQIGVTLPVLTPTEFLEVQKIVKKDQGANKRLASFGIPVSPRHG